MEIVMSIEVKTTRKCSYCKDKIILETGNFVIYKDNVYYHYDCFISFMNSKKRNKLSQDEIMDMIKESKEKNSDKVKYIIDKNHFERYLQRRYDIPCLPKSIYTRLEQIFNGTYKNLSEPISPSDLFDMWKRKEDYLEKTNQWKIDKGEGISDGIARFFYDLAILLTKLDSYKKWKMSQEINVRTKQNIIEENKSKIDYTKMYNNNKEKINIENILEEI